MPPTPGPAPASAPVEIEELNIIAKRLETARAAIEPQIGASTYTMTRQAIEAQPGGANNTLNQVLLQAPGVSQEHPPQPCLERLSGAGSQQTRRWSKPD
jgi:outer membrane receptor for ferrienterochelin and colicins